MTKEELLKEISSLVEKYEGQKPKSILVRLERMPKYGEEYCNLSSDGEVDDESWQYASVDTERYK